MDLKQIEYFCAVAEKGSFTKAAQACFVSQSAISQQIKALEADFECLLVERQGRVVSLTRAGECLARRGRELLDLAHELRSDVSDAALGKPGSLRVGYLNRYDGRELASAVAAFAKLHPSVSVEMQGGSHDDIYRSMFVGDVDMVFNDKRRTFSPKYVNRYLMSCFDFLEVSELNELSKFSKLTSSDLDSQTCIIVSSMDQYENECSYYREVLNFNCAFIHADSLEQARFIVAANRGILPLEARKESKFSERFIRRIPLVGPDGFGLKNEQVRHDYYAFWRKDQRNPYCSEFADILERMFTEPGQP